MRGPLVASPSMLLSRAALAAALSASTPAAALQDAAPTRWYDVRAALAASAEAPPLVDLRTHLTSAAIDALAPPRTNLALGPYYAVDDGDFVIAVRAAAQAEGAALEAVRTEAGFVGVTGDAAAQRAAAAAVDAMSAALLEGVAVEVLRVDDATLPTGVAPVLDPDAADALALQLERAAVTRGVALLGRPVGLGDVEVRTFLYDYDVEVASGAVAADPVVSAVRPGMEVAVQVDRAADGRRFVVRALGRDGSLAVPMRTVEIDGLGGATIELPRVATSLWAVSGLVEPGGALVIDHDGGGSSALVVRIAPEGAAPSPTSVLPLGELALRPMRPEPVRTEVARPSGGWGGDREEVAEATAPWTDGSVPVSVLDEALEPAMEAAGAVRFGSVLLLPVPDAVAPGVRSAVESLAADASIGTVGVEVRYGTLSAAGVRALRAPGGVAAFASSAGPRLMGSALEGDALLLVGGEESAYLQDHDSQIAGGSTIPDPIVAHTFEGIALWCSPLRAPGGALTAWFDVQAHEPAPEPRAVDAVQYGPNAHRGSGSQPIAAGTFRRDLAIELPTTRRVHARTSVRATEGEWALVALRPVPGADATLVVAARMTAR